MKQGLYLTQAGSLTRFWTGPDADVRVAWSPRGNSRRRAVIEPVDKADGLGDALNLHQSIVTARETQTVTLAIIKP